MHPLAFLATHSTRVRPPQPRATVFAPLARASWGAHIRSLTRR
jgi:hypothetical protein